MPAEEVLPKPNSSHSAAGLLRPASTSKLKIDASFATLKTLTDNLSQSVTCPICLDHYCDAQQLQCGHIFCAQCISRMLAMDNARCAICKEKTGKRMIRRAPLNFDAIIEQLGLLQAVVEECDKSSADPKRAVVKDGYDAAVTDAARAKLQLAQQRYKKQVESFSEDTEMQAMVSRKRCVLCPRGIDPISFPDVPFGSYQKAKSDKKDRELFVHESCGLYSEAVYEVDGVMENVLRAVSKTKKYICARDACGRSRANVHCAADGCEKRYHFPCAVMEKCVLVEDGYKMFCSAHRDQAPSIAEVEFDKAMTDPKGAEAQEHDDECYLCNTGGRLLMCDTCERVTHPACSGLKGIPIGDWSCGICTGEYNVVKSTKKHKDKAVKKRKRADMEDPQWDPSSNTKRRSSSKKARKDEQGRQKYVLATTRLDESQRRTLKSVALKKKTSIKPDIDKRVTHLVISAYNRDEAALRTMKLCKAIAARVPIVCWKWVEESVALDQWAAVDAHLHPLTWPKDRAAVFESMRFYFGIFDGPKERREGLEDLVVVGGGGIVLHEPCVDVMSERDIFFVRHEDSNGEAAADKNQGLIPEGMKLITTNEILDRCTKGRNPQK